MKKIIALTVLSFAFFSGLKAQTGFQLEAEGSASPIILNNVAKMPEQAKVKDTVIPAPAFNYTLQTKRYNTFYTPDTIKAAKLSSEPLQKLYRTYAKAGVGNYTTLMGEFYISSLRSKSGAWGANVRHLSAGNGPDKVAGEFSGFSNQDASVWGKRFLKKHTLSGNLDYKRDVVYNYGSTVPINVFTKDFTQQRFNLFEAGTELKSHLRDSDAIHHRGALNYYHFYDRYKFTEDNIRFDIEAGRYIRTEFLNVDVGVDYNRNASSSDTVNNTIIRFKPEFRAHGKKFDASIGVALYHEAGAENLTYFYPQAFFSYDVVAHIIVPYVWIKGGLERNSYRSLTAVNPFVMSSTAMNLRNTQRKYELAGGIKGSVSKEVSFDLRAMLYELKNMALFVNTTESDDIFRNKFKVVYDDVDVMQFHAQLQWQHFEKTRILLTGDYYKFTTTSQLKAWHSPSLRLSAIAQYNLQDKIIGKAQIYYLNGQYALIDGVSGPSAVNVKGLLDINIGMEYRYTKFLSMFLNLNNLAAQRYQRWYAYPTQRFNFMAGLTYTF
ncbi:MAG: hypothetical protein Fur0041_02540 [Bacteroidia bacterium]